MKHLFLFLFDMADSIKASGSNLLLRRQSLLLSTAVTEENNF